MKHSNATTRPPEHIAYVMRDECDMAAELLLCHSSAFLPVEEEAGLFIILTTF